MKLTEWLQTKKKYDQATFIVARSVKDNDSSFYHYEYRTTVVDTVDAWLKGDYSERHIVINADHSPIDITNGWVNWYKKGLLHCAIITTEEDLFTAYSEKQAKQMIEYYDREVRKQMGNLDERKEE